MILLTNTLFDLKKYGIRRKKERSQFKLYSFHPYEKNFTDVNI
jgi:hypothetical protein